MDNFFGTYVYPEDIKKSENNMLLLKEKYLNYYKMFTGFAEDFIKLNIGLIIYIFYSGSDQSLLEFDDDRSYSCVAYNKHNQVKLYQTMNWRKLNYWWKIFADGVDYGYHMRKPITIKHLPRMIQNKNGHLDEEYLKTKNVCDFEFKKKIFGGCLCDKCGEEFPADSL